MHNRTPENRKFLRRRIFLYMLFVIILPAILIGISTWYIIVKYGP